MSAPPFVGRARERRQVAAWLAEAENGHGRLLLVRGEAGIGKTRLAEVTADQARRDGWRVLWVAASGRDVAPAYWPWPLLLRRAQDASTSARDRLAAATVALGTVAEPAGVPFLERQRFHVFAAVEQALHALAGERPTLLALEDLHRWDDDALRLLEFVVHGLAGMPLVLLGTARDGDEGAPVEPLVADPATRGIALAGLDADEVAALVEALLPGGSVAEVAAQVHRRTGGNPYFATEVLLAVAAGASPELAVPEAARALVGARVARLPTAARRVLAAAAVGGIEIEPALLADVLAMTPADTQAALDAAARAHLVRRSSDGGGFVFGHELVRDLVYTDLRADERAQLHARIGETLERRGATEERAAALARHYLAAVSVVGFDRAMEHLLQAATAAARRRAYEQTARHYEEAQALRRSSGATPGRTDVEILLELGDARMRAGAAVLAREAFAAAVSLARRLEAPDLLARAALGLGWWSTDMASVEQELIDALSDAAARLDASEHGLRAWVLARLARARYRAATLEERARQSDEAVTLARRVGDGRTLAYVLSERHQALWGPDGLAERLAVADELIQLAERGGDRTLALIAHTYRGLDLLETGDLTGLERALAVRRRLEDELGEPAHRVRTLQLAALCAALRGEFERAERRTIEARTLGRRLRDPEVEATCALQLMLCARARGTLPAMHDAAGLATARWPAHPALRVGAAFLHVLGGDHASARAEFERLAAREFSDLPRDWSWLPALSILADVCGFLDDRERAALLYEWLLPYADRHVVLGFGIAAMGDVGLYLGRLAAVRRDWDASVGHLERAQARHAAMGARPFLVYGDHVLGRVLLARDGPGDAERGRALLDATLARARSLGMDGPAQAIAVFLDTAAPVGTPRTSATARPSIRRQGDVWQLGYDGSTVHVRDSKGMRVLETLLRHPGREFPAVDLLDDVPRPSRADLGAVLDGRARADYRARLEALRAEQIEAERWNDAARAARAAEEIAAVSAALAAAVGLGGRARRAGSGTERARLIVTKRVRSAVTRIERLCPVLGHHLRTTVHTGSLCGYQPAPDRMIPWDG